MKSKNPRQRKSSRYSSITAKKISIVIIIAVSLIVGIATLASIFLQPERQVHQKIASLASNYYENVFYEKMLNSDQFSGDPAKTLAPRAERGLAIITLRQLLLQDQLADTETANYLLKYCDENSTSVHFYPEAPYSRTSYRAEYTYACNF